VIAKVSVNRYKVAPLLGNFMIFLQSVKNSFHSTIKISINSIWPKFRILLIIIIAVSMAEFVALDAGMMLAADILLYVDAIIGVWTLTAIARFVPGLTATLMFVAGRMFDLRDHDDPLN
jgi:hypothetical protein